MMDALEKYLLQNESGDVAAQTGIGAWLGAATGKGSWDAYRDRRFMKGAKATRSYEDFLSKLQPGDILFQRNPTEFSPNAEIAGKVVPLRETDFMIGVKGDVYYHPGIYKGGKRIIHSEDSKHGIISRNINRVAGPATTGKRGKLPSELIAMRPDDPEIAKKALKRAAQMEGGRYKHQSEILGHGLAHLAGITKKTGNKICSSDGLVCTEFVAEAYPDIFKDRYASPRDMRNAKGLSFAARYAPRTYGVTLGDNILQYGVYPMAKTAKYGLLAAGLGYGGSELLKYLEKTKEGSI